MYCSKCGVQNSEGATHCTHCGSVLMDIPQQPPEQPAPAVPVAAGEPKTCGVAIASFVMGLLCMTCILWPLMVLPAIICGIIALVKINKNKPHLKGTPLAVTGIIIPTVMLILIPILSIVAAIFMPALSKAKAQAHKVVCMTNLKTISLAAFNYTGEYDGQYPTPEQWCDLLIEEAAVSPQTFRCPVDPEGSFSYAINESLGDLQMAQIRNPARFVLLFEADLGRNGVGGLDDIVFRHDQYGQPGCNIAFADGHIEYVTADRIDDLQWTTE